MKRYYFFSLFLLFSLYTDLVFAQHVETPFLKSDLNHHQDLRIVAKVGDIEITAEEFKNNYNYGPAFLKRQNDSKKRYLDVMIYEKLLALEGYAQKLDQSEHVKNILSQVKADLITEELFKEDVMGNVSVTEKEIQQAVKQDLKHVHIKWLFRKSFEKIKNDFKLLTHGIHFDSLFYLQLNDSVLVDDRSMETTLFELNNKNPDLMTIIDTLKMGSFSYPIETQDGYYIVKIDNGWNDALLTETEWNEHNQKMRETLFKQKMDSLSDQYVDNMLLENNPLIKRPAFNLLRAWLAKNILPADLVNAWDFKENTGTEDEQNIDKAINYNLSELVHLNSGSVSLKEFFSWYNPRRTYIKLSQKSKEVFSVSVQNIVWRMLRDKLLTDRAIQRGLQHRENIIRQYRWWEDKTVYAKYKRGLADSVKVTDAEIQDYYNANKDNYRSKGNVYQTFEKVKNEINNILLREKYSSKLIHDVLAAKQKYKIEINDQVLDNIYVDTQNDPRAIEVYTVKKGGLFPRQPYPTIDSEWKYFF